MGAELVIILLNIHTILYTLTSRLTTHVFFHSILLKRCYAATFLPRSVVKPSNRQIKLCCIRTYILVYAADRVIPIIHGIFCLLVHGYEQHIIEILATILFTQMAFCRSGFIGALWKEMNCVTLI